ncbi:NAD(P) transhydrogenase subunit alpha [Dongia sp.]|uniref:NAD(P) transhydrogenase subunit alpha n=1 Tax=Dongia sp. TaxID=1977262 RepID=UPI0037512EAD
MNPEELSQKAVDLANAAQDVAAQAGKLSQDVTSMAVQAVAEQSGHTPFVQLFTVFVLACFVGYYVVWRVTPALHSPLMAVTNGISSVIIVGALIAAGPADFDLSKIMGLVAVALAAVNICGGFLVTHRMLSMFKKKEPAKGGK